MRLVPRGMFAITTFVGSIAVKGAFVRRAKYVMQVDFVAMDVLATTIVVTENCVPTREYLLKCLATALMKAVRFVGERVTVQVARTVMQTH
jgi:hypothetical protein